MTNNIKLTEKQQEFVDKVYEDELQLKKGIFVLKGFAGTGKTYTLSTIVNKSNFENILVVAPTVMARTVLQTKLPSSSRNRNKTVNYSTLSKLIQVPKEVITVMNTKFILNTAGITDLKNLLSRMKIDTEGLIQTRPVYVIDSKTGKSVLADEPKYIINEEELKNRFNTRFKGRGSTMVGEVKPDFDYLPLTDIVEKIKDIDLILVDEMSMVGQEPLSKLIEAVDHLNTYIEKNGKMYGKAIPTVVLAGDPGQLPPVDEELNEYFLNDDLSSNDRIKYSSKLETILRSGDDIARMAGMIRKKLDPKKVAEYSKDGVIFKGDVDKFIQNNKQLLSDVDIAIAFTNADVYKLNSAIRNSKGYTGSRALVGETLIVLENTQADWQGNVEFSNGESYEIIDKLDLAYVKNLFDSELYKEAKESTLVDEALIALDAGYVELVTLMNRNGELKTAFIATNIFDTTSMLYKNVKEIFKNLSILADGVNPFVVVNFGYARTIHKSQGSEWDNVLLWITSKNIYGMKKNNPKNWQSLLYTGYTRAAKHCHFIYGDLW